MGISINNKNENNIGLEEIRNILCKRIKINTIAEHKNEVLNHLHVLEYEDARIKSIKDFSTK